MDATFVDSSVSFLRDSQGIFVEKLTYRSYLCRNQRNSKQQTGLSLRAENRRRTTKKVDDENEN